LWFALYGSSSVRLQDLDFDREQLKVVQGKVKTATFPIKTFNSRTQTYIEAKTYLFNGQPKA
jgi:hypothetical protein